MNREPANYFEATAWTADGPLYRADDKEESPVTISRALVGLSVLAFVLAIFNVPIPADQMQSLGLALFAAGHFDAGHHHA